MPFRVSRERFERLAEQALQALPEEYKEYFDNIAIMVEDYPTREDIGRSATGKDLLLGIFRGVPYPAKGGFFEIPHPLPDKIVLFQKNIENVSSSEEELIEEIRTTLIHEVGHYFGLSEEDLQQYEE